MTQLANHHLATKLAKTLAELPAAYEQLFWYWLPGGRPADTGSLQHHSALDTRALIMLDVLDLTDTRIKPDSDPTRDDYELDRVQWSWEDGDGRKVTEPGRYRQGVVPTLRGWVTRIDAEMWDADQPHPEPPDQMTAYGECNWLTHQLDWSTAQPWLSDITADVNRMFTDVQRVVKEMDFKLICTECGWRVEEQDGGAWYRCTGCGWARSRMELHRAAERKKPKTLAEIASLINVSLKTLRTYADKGYLKVVARYGKASLYDLDAVALATMNLKYKRSSVRVA